MSSDPNRERERQIATDRETIREWTDRHEAVPVRHRTTERYHLLPEGQVTEDYERLERDTFHDELERGEYVVTYREDATEEPFEVLPRDEAVTRTGMDHAELEERLIEGEVVTSTITETTVVESVVVEEATVESELVDTDVIDQQVVDVELLGRECTGCDLVETGEVIDDEWFDRDRYLGSFDRGTETGDGAGVTETTIERQFPYTAELEVEEAWTVSREITERFTVESRITETDVMEADTIDDHDIDVEGLQREIVEQGLLDIGGDPDEILKEYEVRSEMTRGDRIDTHFERTTMVEDEVVDRMYAYADVTSADVQAMDVAAEREVYTETTGDAGLAEADTASTETTATTGYPILSAEDEGKTVVDNTGTEIGRVDNIADGGETMWVEPKGSITERIMSALDWGDSQEEYTITADHIETITDDTVRLRDSEELVETTASDSSEPGERNVTGDPDRDR